jgi:hypothetical protein
MRNLLRAWDFVAVGSADLERIVDSRGGRHTPREQPPAWSTDCGRRRRAGEADGPACLARASATLRPAQASPPAWARAEGGHSWSRRRARGAEQRDDLLGIQPRRRR